MLKKNNRNVPPRRKRSAAKKWSRTVNLITACSLAMGISFVIHPHPAEAASKVHSAKEGDTYYVLSKQYGVDLNKLMQANPSIKATNIYAGLKITIPSEAKAVAATKAQAASPAVMLPTLNVFPENKVVEAWGKTFDYSKTLNVKATAYSSAASENGGWGAVDYFGNPLELGTIAVDPKVIPLGTKVLVTGHTHPGLPKKAFVAEARDIGGAIKGNKIDIFIPGSPKSVREFGIQDVTLYFIK